MTLVNIVLVVLYIVTILIGLYFLKRDKQVYDFRINVSNLCYERAIKIIKQHKGNKSPDWHLYDKLPSYKSMLYSFKPLKLESYFTEEEIKELTKN